MDRKDLVPGYRTEITDRTRTGVSAPVVLGDLPKTNPAQISYFEQRTIEIGRYKFARVGVGLRVVVHDVDAEEAGRQVAHVCNLLLQAEVASITKEPFDPVVPALDIQYTRPYIKVLYGFTIPKGKMDSVKFDIEDDRPLEAGESLADGYQRIAAGVSARAREMYKATTES